MARGHARIYATIWSDPDFLALDAGAQRAYMLVASQADLSPCGVLPYNPKRWARLASDTTPAKMAKALRDLAERRFVVIDFDTDEVWIRTFIRHDGVLSSPNIAKSMARAYGAIHSPRIRTGILAALPEPLREGFPERFVKLPPKALGELIRKALVEQSPEPLVDHSLLPPPSSRPFAEPDPDPGQPTEPPRTGGEESKAGDGAPARGGRTPNDDRLDRLWPLLADRRRRLTNELAATGQCRAVTRPETWLPKVAADYRDRLGSDASGYLERFPTWSVERLADELDPETATAQHRVPSVEETQARQRADEAERAADAERSSRVQALVDAMPDDDRAHLRQEAEELEQLEHPRLTGSLLRRAVEGRMRALYVEQHPEAVAS